MLGTTALLGALLVPAICFGGTLTATTRTDAPGGIFMNFTTAAQQLWTIRLDPGSTTQAAPGVRISVDVEPGSYIGFDSSELSQTLRETLAAIGAGASISQITGNSLSSPHLSVTISQPGSLLVVAHWNSEVFDRTHSRDKQGSTQPPRPIPSAVGGAFL